MKINEHYSELGGNYLFAEMKRKTAEFQRLNPDADIIKLGIGDVTLPLTPAVIEAMHRAVDEMGSASSFRGYGPEQGYDFLIDSIIRHEYESRGIKIKRNEIFVSDGSKCDVANIQEIFSTSCTAAICDPVYPVYRDSNIMAGRKIILLPCTRENDFVPELPQKPVDIVYLCSPNNPTGKTLTRNDLTRWVNWAHEKHAIILFDSAYSAYIRDPELPGSIYEIPGAEEVAIEFKSFSKTAGFTGLRCAFTVVPEAAGTLNAMWNRRHCTKFNGVSYIIQRAAEAVYSDTGRRETTALIDYYMENAAIIRNGLRNAGFKVHGGENAPYIWWELPEGLDSMNFSTKLLESCRVVGTPGIGFGSCGEGFFRLTAFGNRAHAIEAVSRIRELKIDRIP
ncbi:MAG: LL-diaminopimelate aminotransferase [Victivallaceae bacterium]|nr:LL-diaminopimelate aminotransferase [Victivallaceae bacterium]MDD3702789.1 LL-diaminopimelate aminotransferase [Victivallaceae bacterium]MDD4317400.1 LL-diaminopimelate aminotransferase [Victivallaceae bacterium]MDD5662910.1 LL-diaminopimelate aminotransferase [Victivallaceae bacterium]